MTESRTSSGFRLSDYSRLVTATAKRYRCLGYEVVESPPERFALLRHDIDMSPVQALELARIESDAGVRATYTVLLNGEHYAHLRRKRISFSAKSLILGMILACTLMLRGMAFPMPIA